MHAKSNLLIFFKRIAVFIQTAACLNFYFIRCDQYRGQVCRNLTGNSQAASLHTGNVDMDINSAFHSLLGVNVTEACRQVLLVGLCADYLFPCDQEKVWCGKLSLNELRTKAAEECQCEVGTALAQICNWSRNPTLNTYFDGLSDEYFKWDPQHPVVLPEGKTCQLIGKGSFTGTMPTFFLIFNSCIHTLFTSFPINIYYRYTLWCKQQI